MAAGDGFKQVPFGFDKNEVNTYISDLRKKMNALEADMRANDEKTREAEKLAEEADSRIKAAQEEADKKVEEITSQLEEEKSTTSRQLIEIRNLKERLDTEKKKMTDVLKSGKGVSQEATRAFNEVLDKANEEAAAIIENAKQQAQQIIEAAQQHRNTVSEKTEAFMAQLREQIESMNAGFNSINRSAAEILGTESAPAVTLPEPAAAPAPVFIQPEELAEVPDMSVFDAVPEEEEQPEPEPAEEDQPEYEAAAEEPEQPAEEPEPVYEEAPTAEEEESPAVFDGEWSGNEMADAVAAAERQMAEAAKKDIPLVNPETTSDPFGGDLFSMNDNHDDMTGFAMEDKHDEPEQEESVDAISPLDVSDHAEAAYDHDFTKDLLAQTLPSSSLGADADDDLLAAVRAAEEAAAVKPSDVSDIDMDEESATASGASEEDDLMKALREAEAAFGGTSSDDESNDSDENDDASAEDPWAALQKQLEAMESANGAGSAVTYDEPEPDPVQEEPAEDPQVAPPSADDSSIWNFGSSSDDDDMSSDFGGFSGF